MKKLLLVVGMAALMVGCKPVEIPAQMVTDARICVSDVKQMELAYQQAEEARAVKARSAVVQHYKSEQNALIALALTNMAKIALKEEKDVHAEALGGELLACAEPVVAYLRTTGQINANQHATAQKVTGASGVVLGVVAGGYAIEQVLGSVAGSTSGDTWTVNGSRVTNKSGNASGGGYANASSSGDGLGQANSFNRAGADQQTVSGFEPRTNPVQTDSIVTNQPQSASGTNETAIPREGDAPELPAPE